MNTNTDPDFQILTALSASLEVDYTEGEEQWAGSPFAWIKRRPSRQIGAIGEKLVSGYLASKGFDVTRSPDSEADRLVNKTRVEIKYSSLWETGSYKFQQLRDQNYQFAICLGVSPFSAHCWVLPKSAIMKRWGNELPHQHGGKKGSDTVWLQVTPGDEPAWLDSFGGPLSSMSDLVAKYSGQAPLS